MDALLRALDHQGVTVTLVTSNCESAGPSTRYFGDGPERDAVAASIARYGLSDPIIIVGAIRHNELIATLAQARCLLLPSREEGMPNAILEAMALGIPVIAAAVGGVPELVAHGETGYLFSPDDVDEAKHFLEIAADAERARMVGMRARQTAQAKFHLSHVVQSYIELYRTLLTERQVETRHVG